MKAPAHFHLLRAACLPHLQHYHGDLLRHDRRLIRRHPDLPFIHVTRDMGSHTQLMPLADHPLWPEQGKEVPYLFGKADRYHLLRDAEGFMDYFIKNHRESSVLVHHFDGRELHRIDYAKGDEILRQWARDVRQEWAQSARMRRCELDRQCGLLARDTARILALSA
jgi:hypothetical protein